MFPKTEKALSKEEIASIGKNIASAQQKQT
jgi:hypothetical protein